MPHFSALCGWIFKNNVKISLGGISAMQQTPKSWEKMAKTMQQWTLKLIHISYNFNQQARRGSNPALNLSEGPKLVSTILPASIELIYSGIELNCLEKVGVCKFLFRRYMNLDLVTLKLSLTEFQSSDHQNTLPKVGKLGNFEDLGHRFELR